MPEPFGGQYRKIRPLRTTGRYTGHRPPPVDGSEFWRNRGLSREAVNVIDQGLDDVGYPDYPSCADQQIGISEIPGRAD